MDERPHLYRTFKCDQEGETEDSAPAPDEPLEPSLRPKKSRPAKAIDASRETVSDLHGRSS